MKYRIYGKPNKIVLHGGPSAIGSASDLAKSLFNCIELFSYADTIEGQIKEIHDLVLEFNLKELVLIGHSWGAWLGYIYASKYRVTKLILIGCGAFSESYLSIMNERRENKLSTEEMDLVNLFFDKIQKQEPIENMYELGKLMAKMDSYQLVHYDDDLIEFDALTHKKLMDEIRSLRKSGELLELGKQITAEVVVIHGKEDPHPYEGVIEPFDSIDLDCRHYLLEECGHTPWHEVGAELFYEILDKETSYLFQSQRLGFRHFKLSDEMNFLEMNCDEEVMKYFPNVLNKETSKAFLDRIIDKYQLGFGLYAVEILESSEFIGFIGLSQPGFEMSFTPCVEIGWRLMSKSWRKGYASEGASRVLKYAFENIRLKEIVSFTSEINIPSVRVMTSIGMTFSQNFDYPLLEGKLKNHVLYKVKNE